MKHARSVRTVAVGDVRPDGTVFDAHAQPEPAGARGQLAMMLARRSINVVVRIYAGPVTTGIERRQRGRGRRGIFRSARKPVR